MPYSFKITRNINDSRVKVQDITPAARDTSPYRKRATGYIESLQVYSTREEAEKARAAELLAADFSALPAEKLHEILQGDLDRVTFFGLSRTAAARLCKMKHDTLLAYAYGKLPPNPRKTARVHILADLCENVASYVGGLLLEDAGCGNFLKARKGNPKFHTYSPTWKKSRGISQSGT